MPKQHDINRRLEQALREAIKSTLQRIPVLLQGLIGQQFGDRRAKPGTPNATDKLRVISQRLFRSYAPNSPDNIMQIIDRGGSTWLRYGTKVPYARINEEGGEISQTIPITEAMRKFFWAQWYATKEGKWKAFALTRKQTIRRTIRIRKRPTIKPALNNFRKQMPQLQRLLRQELWNNWNAGR